MKNWFKNIWRNLRVVSLSAYGILFFVLVICTGFGGLWSMTLGQLIFCCTMAIIMGIFFLREALVALFTEIRRGNQNVKYDKGSNKE